MSLISACDHPGPAGTPRAVRKPSGNRYPIRQDVYYVCNGKHNSCEGYAKTIEITSREVIFASPHVFKSRQKIRLNINWPVLLGDVCLLKLQVIGSVSQSEPGRTRVAIQRYHFRTGPIAPQKLPFLVLPPPTDSERDRAEDPVYTPAGELTEFIASRGEPRGPLALYLSKPFSGGGGAA